MRRLTDLWADCPTEPTWRERAVVLIPLALLLLALAVDWRG